MYQWFRRKADFRRLSAPTTPMLFFSVLDAQYSVRLVRCPLIGAIRNYRALPGTSTALKAYDWLSPTKAALLRRLAQPCTNVIDVRFTCKRRSFPDRKLIEALPTILTEMPRAPWAPRTLRCESIFHWSTMQGVDQNGHDGSKRTPGRRHARDIFSSL